MLFKLSMKFQLSFVGLLIIIIISCNPACRNEGVVDSNFNKNDSLVINHLFDSLSQNYLMSNDSLVLFSDYIISSFDKSVDLINIRIAHSHYAHSNYFLAQEYFDHAAQIYLADSLIENYAEQISNIGVVKEVSGDYMGAIENYILALSIFDSIDVPLKKSYINNNIGIVYQQLDKNKEALSYYHKSLEISQKLGREDINASRYNNIATIYEEDYQDYDSALYYYHQAHLIYTTENQSKRLPILENNMGYIYLQQKQFNKADSLFSKALEFSLEYKLDNVLGSIYRNQSLLLIEQKRPQAAEDKALEAVNFTRKNQFKEKEIKALMALSEIYERRGKHEKANTILKTYHELKEELASKEEEQHISQLNIKYQVNEKEHQIQVLELENNVQSQELLQLWLFIAVLVVLLSGLFFIYRLQKRNSKLLLRQMKRDLADYIAQLEEIKEDQNKKEEELKSEVQEEQLNNEQHILKQLKQFGLTEREESVLILISKGYKNAEIAEKMFVSINTIKTHTKNLFIKLDVRNRIEASRKAHII